MPGTFPVNHGNEGHILEDLKCSTNCQERKPLRGGGRCGLLSRRSNQNAKTKKMIWLWVQLESKAIDERAITNARLPEPGAALRATTSQCLLQMDVQNTHVFDGKGQ
jgi:hypothetical protein